MINVGGFLFEDETIAAQAKKEEEGILFIKEKSSLSNPEVVFKLYKTVLQQKLFVTPVGLRFLMELQSVLMESSSIPKEEIPAIDTSVFIKRLRRKVRKLLRIVEESVWADRPLSGLMLWLSKSRITNGHFTLLCFLQLYLDSL